MRIEVELDEDLDTMALGIDSSFNTGTIADLYWVLGNVFGKDNISIQSDKFESKKGSIYFIRHKNHEMKKDLECYPAGFGWTKIGTYEIFDN